MSVFTSTIQEGVIGYCSGKMQSQNPYTTDPNKSEWNEGWLKELEARCKARDFVFSIDKAYEKKS